MRTQSLYTQRARLKRGKTRVTKSRLVLVLNLIGGTSFLDQSQGVVKQNQCNPGLLSSRHSIENCSNRFLGLQSVALKASMSLSVPGSSEATLGLFLVLTVTNNVMILMRDQNSYSSCTYTFVLWSYTPIMFLYNKEFTCNFKPVYYQIFPFIFSDQYVLKIPRKLTDYQFHNFEFWFRARTFELF